MRKFNFNEFVYLIILCIIDLFFIYLIRSRKIVLYIGTKEKTFIFFAVIMLTLMSVMQVFNVFTFKNNNSTVKCMPLICAVILGGISLNNVNDFSNNDVLGYMISNIAASDNTSTMMLKVKQNDRIVLTEDNAENILHELYNDPEHYKGSKIIVKNFNIGKYYAQNNMYLIEKNIIHCCLQDSVNIGILIKMNNSYDLKDTQNYSICGELNTTIVNYGGRNQMVPYIDKVEVARFN